MWVILFVALWGLYQIIEQMLVVAAVGAVSNAAGAGLYKVGESIEKATMPLLRALYRRQIKREVMANADD